MRVLICGMWVPSRTPYDTVDTIIVTEIITSICNHGIFHDMTKCLCIMSTESPPPLPPPPFVLTASTGAPTGRAGEISFKDVVEAYAADSGVTFMPRPGREHEGKQVWVFGKSTCYLDQDVVFASVGDGTWRPMALEDLLKIS